MRLLNIGRCPGTKVLEQAPNERAKTRFFGASATKHTHTHTHRSSNWNVQPDSCKEQDARRRWPLHGKHTHLSVTTVLGIDRLSHCRILVTSCFGMPPILDAVFVSCPRTGNHASQVHAVIRTCCSEQRWLANSEVAPLESLQMRIQEQRGPLDGQGVLVPWIG